MKRMSFAALTAAAVLPLGAQVRPQSSPIPEAELVKRVAATVDSLVKLNEFSGVVLLAKDGKPVFEKAYGLADREAKTPNTIETAFNIGSINKLFTQIAIRQLATEGKLNLDSTL